MSIDIKVNVNPGSSIEDAAIECVTLANRLKIPVEFKFNDVNCYARPGGDPAKLVVDYHEQIGSPRQYKFAST